MLELTSRDIHLGKQAVNKEEAILNIAKDLIEKGFVLDGYQAGMLAREAQNSTFLGNGIAIPHGTTDTRNLVKHTGIQIHHFQNGVDWGDGNMVYLAIGIAAKSDEHLGILKQLTRVLSRDGVEEALKNAQTEKDILAVLTEDGGAKNTLRFDEGLVTLNFPASDLISLVAVGAGKIKETEAVTNVFVSAVIEKQPTYLGQGLWITSSDKGVHQTAVFFISVQVPFEQQSHPVNGLVVVAASGPQYIEILKNLSNLLFNGKINELFEFATESLVIKALTEIRQAGQSQIFKIRNEHGLHARPGATLVNVAKQFETKIWVSNLNGDAAKQVNAKSLMKVIALGVKQGNELEFVADGIDAEQALHAIGIAIENGLGEV